MKWLYDHGAQEDVRAPDNGGRTPLNTSLKHLDNTCRYSGSIKFPELRNMHLNIFRVIWGDRKTANFDEEYEEDKILPYILSHTTPISRKRLR